MSSTFPHFSGDGAGRGADAGRGMKAWTKLNALPPQPGEYYVARGELFFSHRHRCTRVAVWCVGCDELRLLMTDLSPARCDKAFYGL